MTGAAPEHMVSRARRLFDGHFLFLANFGAAKLCAYFVPLALAAVAGEGLYGGIELALAIGLQVCAFTLGAPLAGTTHVYLVQRRREVADLLLLLTFGAAAALLLLGGGLMLAGIGGLALLAVAATSSVVIQNVASVWTRMRNERNRAAWVDSASLLIAGAIVLATLALAGPDDLGTATWGFGLLTLLLALWSGLMLLRHRAAGLGERLRHVTRVGLPMMAAGAFAIWLGVGGRILVGIATPSDLAAYSLAFRVAGLALGIHQLSQTIAFPRFYASRTREGDRLLGGFFGAVLALSALLALAGPFVVDLIDFAALDAHGREMYRALVPLCALQTFFWIGFATLQMRINRFRAAKASILPMILVTFVGIGLILLAARFVSADVRFIAWLVALHAAAYFAAAWLLLAKRRVPHIRIGLIGALGGLGLAAVAAVATI